jgi:hypothetical protein
MSARVAALIALLAAELARAGGPAQPPTSPVIREVVAAIRPATIEQYVTKLVSFGTRHTLSDAGRPDYGIGAARTWIRSELERCSKERGGRLEVSYDEFRAGPMPRIPEPAMLVNVVAILPGDSEVSRANTYVVSGHYDSINSVILNATDAAPGADDDASGTAAVMALACAMATQHFPATIVFLAVAGEEQGLVGAKHWAETAKAANRPVLGMFTNDIIGSSHDEHGVKDASRVRLFAEGVPPSTTLSEEWRTLISTGGENDSPTRELARYVRGIAARYVPEISVDIVYRRDRYLRGGDHLPFLDAGYPALRFTEAHEDFRHQHQTVRVEDGVQYGDLPQFVDPEYTARIARVNGAALAALALSPAPPANAELLTAKLENDSTLSWEMGAEPDLAGYRVLLRRTTSPDWESAREVGLVTQVTLPGVSKDDWLFAVEAVNRAGIASVPSYPRPHRPAR